MAIISCMKNQTERAILVQQGRIQLTGANIGCKFHWRVNRYVKYSSIIVYNYWIISKVLAFVRI